MKTALIALTLLFTLLQASSHIPSANAQVRTAAATPRATQAPAAARPPQMQVPSAEAQVIMIRSTLMALSHANQTNNYAVLNALGSPGFQSANPPARLAQVFQAFRANNIDLAPVSLLAPRQLSAPIVAGGKLRLVGAFPSQPMQVNYDLTFEPMEGQWRLFGLAVNLKQAQDTEKAVPAKQ